MLKKRGPTRGLELAKKRRAGDKNKINIPEHKMRPVGENCQLMITDTGCIVRLHASMQVRSSGEIPKDQVAMLIRRARDKFELGDEPHVNEAIVEDMKHKFWRHHYLLYQKFKKYAIVEEALVNTPRNCTESDWKYLIGMWQEEHWKKVSEKKMANRTKLLVHHAGGSKSFSRIGDENKDENPGLVDMITLTLWNLKKNR